MNLWVDPRANLEKIIWPALILAWGLTASIARVTRSSVLEVLHQDYVRTARSKGLDERAVGIQHALRNALIPVLTIGALQFGFLLGGSVLMENLFGLPGIGAQIITSANNRDFPVVQAIAMLMVLLMLSLSLVTDLAYGLVDPRIRMEQ